MKRKIVFMGTPQFAVPILEALLSEEALEVVAVITAVDKPGGRGRKQLLQSAVKQTAIKHDLTILQPSNLKSPHFVKTFQELHCDLAIVVAFRMLPEVIWSAPKYGTMNLHASLLPAYRGAAPINWAIINGEKVTGLTTFMIAKDIDTGNIVYQETLAIGEKDTAGSLHDRMMHLGAALVVKSAYAVLNQEVILKEQPHHLATKAPKIYHEDCEIKTNDTTLNLYNFIRGLSPYPGAWLKVDGRNLKIYETEFFLEPHTQKSGSLVASQNKDLFLYLSDGYLKLLEVQLEGKRRMAASSLLNGYDLEKSEDIYTTN
jgi:methionyl-tRNA formyltransferase